MVADSRQLGARRPQLPASGQGGDEGSQEEKPIEVTGTLAGGGTRGEGGGAASTNRHAPCELCRPAGLTKRDDRWWSSDHGRLLLLELPIGKPEDAAVQHQRAPCRRLQQVGVEEGGRGRAAEEVVTSGKSSDPAIHAGDGFRPRSAPTTTASHAFALFWVAAAAAGKGKPRSAVTLRPSPRR